MRRSVRFVRSFSCACVALAFGIVNCTFNVPARAGEVVARWLEPVSGDWTDPTRWTSNPFYPDNGSPAEAVYQAFIDAPGPDYTVTLNASVDVGSVAVRSPDALLHQTGGVLTAFSVRAGDVGVGRYRMSDGTLNVNGLFVGGSPSSTAGVGTFEVLRGYVNNVAGTTTVVGMGTGTLLVSGGQSRYVTVPSAGSSFWGVHVIGVGSMSRGVAQFSNFASVSLGRAEIGGAEGAGTVLVDSGAKVFIDGLHLGRTTSFISNGTSNGDGTVILSGGSRLTLGAGSISIGAGTGPQSGSGNVLVNGGTLTLLPASPVSFFLIHPTGTFSVNGGTVESQRVPWVGGGQFIVNGGTVTVPGFRVATAGFTVPGGMLALNGGRLTAGTVSLLGGNYAQSAGIASLGVIELRPNGESWAPIHPSARLAGGTFGAAGLYVNSGTFTYQSGVFDVGYLSVTGGRLVATPGRDKTLRVSNLAISGAGRLDLGDNFMLLDSGAAPPIANVRALLRAGYNGGAWDGPGIGSSVAQETPGHGIGYVQPSPLFTALLVAYTRNGDADVDGAVDLADFNALAENFATGDDWFEGDFNYDGVVNLRDFNLLAANFGLSARGPGVSPGDWATLAGVVPEPATGLLVLAVPPLLRRRRNV